VRVIGEASLSGGAYVVGAVSFVAVLGVVAWGAVRARAGVLPEWSGARARVAEAVIAIGVVILVAQALGSFGLLEPLPVLVALLAAGGALVVIAPRAERAPAPRDDRDEGRSGRRSVEWWAMVAGGGLVAAQWAAHVADTFRRGMTHADTLWYHAPYAAEMLRTGHTNDLLDRTDALQTYYPLNGSVVHTLVMLPFDRDLLSPLVNLAWAALALVSAWCIGRRRGVAELSVLGALVVLALPMLVGTQPGQASNDVAVSALLLASVALLLESELEPVAVLLAGVAAGLAVGTKLTVLLPVLVLTVGVIVLALRARARVSALVWPVGVLVCGSYWYVRNWVVAQSPFPWFEASIGPLHFPQRAENTGPSLGSRLFDGDGWSELYAPGFWQSLGRVWPIVLTLLVVSAVLTVFGSGRTGLERLVGVTIASGVVAYLLTPESGGLNFAFNVRYLAPVLLVGFVVLPLALAGASSVARNVSAVAALALLVVEAVSPDRERVDAWPGDVRAVAVIVGVAAVVLAILWRPLTRAAHRVSRPAMVGIALALVAGVAIAGWPLQRYFLDRRYVDAGLAIDDLHAYFRDVADSSVVVYGTVETYPFEGVDLSNDVHKGLGPSSRADTDPCREWADLRRGDYAYAVLTRFGLVGPTRPPTEWFTDDPAVTEVAREDDSVVYRIDGPLHPASCAR
jgi:hypothetical protein